MTDFLIPKPTEIAINNYKGTHIARSKNAAYTPQEIYALAKEDFTSWWAIGMAFYLNNVLQVIVVSNNDKQACVQSNRSANPGNTIEFLYGNQTYYYSAIALEIADDYIDTSETIIPVYLPAELSITSYEDAALELISLYSENGGILPGGVNYPTSWVQRLIEGAWQKTFAFAHAKTVYTDYANKKTLADKLSEIDTEIGNKANKTEIPTELPANGGNSATVNGHTVKSDVPENAVFTDTIYDDTEVQKSISQQSTEMMDIKMLGWSVPRECPIQNEVNGNQFVQKVGRVDLVSLIYVEHDAYGVFTEGVRSSIKIHLDTETASSGIYCKGYLPVSWSVLVSAGKTDTNHIADNGEGIIGFNTTLSAEQFQSKMQGKYLYYELATPITTTIDGNEIGETISDVRKETTVNLLKPTLETTTRNGVTCTNNGDGTYILNGTATSETIFQLGFDNNLIVGKTYKVLGMPITGSDSTIKMVWDYHGFFYNKNGLISTKVSDSRPISLIIAQGYTCDNLVIKPMFTTNLNATYDDFVPYTGNSGSLNGDVAELKNDLVGKSDSIKDKTITVTSSEFGVFILNKSILGVNDISNYMWDFYCYDNPRVITNKYIVIDDAIYLYVWAVNKDGILIGKPNTEMSFRVNAIKFK